MAGSKDDPIFVRKGEHVPRNKAGCKKGYYPERSLHEPKHGSPQPKRVMTRAKGEGGGAYTQMGYDIPDTTPPHLGRDGKPYASVHRRWSSPGDLPDDNALFRSSIMQLGQKQGRAKKRNMGKPKTANEQHKIYGTPSLGRSWVNPNKPKGM